ncbi:Octaprenyl-diphosphate synthase [Rickettsiales bacterium Ac37b]|nr:Octaprenyl-diphosphate synthase [Rickettsiales bacterium Ac37b]
MHYKEKIDKSQNLRHLVLEDLQGVDKLIASSLQGKEALILLLANHLMSAGGKRLRTILALASAKLCNYTGEYHIFIAAAIEFIHAATLLHDDVVDESNLRRGVPTANSTWGNKASILVGDYFLGQAFRWLVDSQSMRALEILSDTSTIIAEGEVMQLDNMNNVALSVEKYLEIVKAKTAALFAASCQVGAVIANRPVEEESALYNFGLNLGIAFQIMDDILDYNSNQNQLGKAIGDDFREGKMTLPAIIAYNFGTKEEQLFWHRTIVQLDQNSSDLEMAINLVHKYNSIDLSIECAGVYIDNACSSINIFQDSAMKSALVNLSKNSLQRLY